MDCYLVSSTLRLASLHVTYFASLICIFFWVINLNNSDLRFLSHYFVAALGVGTDHLRCNWQEK